MSTEISAIKDASAKKLQELRDTISSTVQSAPYSKHICIFACGSLGRLELMPNSDLDIFFIWDDDSNSCGSPEQNSFFDILLGNSTLNLEDPRKLGKYNKLLKKEQLLDIGSQQEDYNNSFTARMLLLLESKPLFNESMYTSIIHETISKYFADYYDHAENFSPLFLMNDIQRYWLTLLLNYEYRRDYSDTPDIKYWKRLKLKYARLITCYSLIACLYEKNITPKHVENCVFQTPFERIDSLASTIPDLNDYAVSLHHFYEEYLELRTKGLDYWQDESHKIEAMKKADQFHDVLIHQFMKSVAKTNPSLHRKSDIY